MSFGEFSPLRIVRNGALAAAMAVALSGVGAKPAQAGGEWIAGAVLGGLVAGAIINHANAQPHKRGYRVKYGYRHRAVRKVRVVEYHQHLNFPPHVHIRYYYDHNHHHHR